jgi:hypothetical protein
MIEWFPVHSIAFKVKEFVLSVGLCSGADHVEEYCDLLRTPSERAVWCSGKAPVGRYNLETRLF